MVAGETVREVSPFVDEGLRIRLLTAAEMETAVERPGLDRAPRRGDRPRSAPRGSVLPPGSRSRLGRGDRRRVRRLPPGGGAEAPDFPEVYRSAGQWLAKDGRWDEVIDCWSDHIGRAPRSPAGYLERGGAYQRKGDRERARADVETACRLGESRACEALRRLSS